MKHLQGMIGVGSSYHPKDTLSESELEKLSEQAAEQFCTMNGDTGTIEITVRQFALLLSERQAKCAE